MFQKRLYTRHIYAFARHKIYVEMTSHGRGIRVLCWRIAHFKPPGAISREIDAYAGAPPILPGTCGTDMSRAFYYRRDSLLLLIFRWAALVRELAAVQVAAARLLVVKVYVAQLLLFQSASVLLVAADDGAKLSIFHLQMRLRVGRSVAEARFDAAVL